MVVNAPNTCPLKAKAYKGHRFDNLSAFAMLRLFTLLITPNLFEKLKSVFWGLCPKLARLLNFEYSPKLAMDLYTFRATEDRLAGSTITLVFGNVLAGGIEEV